MKNLLAEMIRAGVQISDIEKLLECTNRTVKNKLDSKTEFSVNEALKIRNAFFPGMRIDYLFADDNETKIA